jgi:hypothetical protein
VSESHGMTGPHRLVVGMSGSSAPQIGISLLPALRQQLRVQERWDRTNRLLGRLDAMVPR